MLRQFLLCKSMKSIFMCKLSRIYQYLLANKFTVMLQNEVLLNCFAKSFLVHLLALL